MVQAQIFSRIRKFFIACALLLIILHPHILLAVGKRAVIFICPTVTCSSLRATYEAEVAMTPEDHSKGLMFRKTMPRHAGMLFVYERPESVQFWMKNTFIPLDVLFIDANNKIYAIHENRRPHDQTHFGPQHSKTHLVLEINAGEVQHHRIQIGDFVRYTNL